MHDVLELVSSTRKIKGTISLPASKSISNRLLILEAISNGKVKGIGYSDADDTQVLHTLLQQLPSHAYAGAGGTTIRFLLAYLAGKEGYEGHLSGTPRLMERPIAPLVDALRLLGADIHYIEKEGFAPLYIRGRKLKGGSIHVDASLSSQFLTALLLVAPSMENDLEVIPQGEVISASYLEMTLRLMQQCGIELSYDATSIRVKAQLPQKRIDIPVERDWSAASYWYAFTALAEKADILLSGLRLTSLQGDASCAAVFRQLGVESCETAFGIELKKVPVETTSFHIDCKQSPDLLQTYASTIAGLHLQAEFDGLQSLRHKETDRIAAVRKELAKVQVKTEEPNEGNLLMDARMMNTNTVLIVDTYEDHRVAMAFAPLVLVMKKLAIRQPDVVAKSYPAFWTEVRRAGISFAEL